jgi:hypothetical protein
VKILWNETTKYAMIRVQREGNKRNMGRKKQKEKRKY